MKNLITEPNGMNNLSGRSVLTDRILENSGMVCKVCGCGIDPNEEVTKLMEKHCHGSGKLEIVPRAEFLVEG